MPGFDDRTKVGHEEVRMTQGSFSVTIQAPPDVVWPWVSQLEKHVEWSTKPYSVEWISGPPNAVGSRYRSVGSMPTDKDHVNEGESTESVPNQRFALRADDPEGPFHNTYTIAPTAEGTSVTFRLVFPKMSPPKAAIGALIFNTTGKADIRRRMALLKQRVEAST